MIKTYYNTNTSELMQNAQNLELENGQPLEPPVANRGVIHTSGAAISDNCIIVDWLTFASKSWGFDEMVCLLGLTGKQWTKGKASRLHYENVLQFGHIYIHFTSHDSKKYNPGACCEMSGQGCREFETYSDIDFTRLFQFLYSETYTTYNGIQNDITISRLDLAFDDHSGVFNLLAIAEMAQNIYFTSSARLKSFEVVRSYKQLDKDKCGLSVMFGSRESPVYIRIYDKRVERNAFDLDHWVRCEIQLRKDAASGFITNFCSNIGESFPLGELFTSILANYIIFRCPSTSDSNKSRWSVCPFWRRILGDIERISVFTPKNVEYNLDRMEKYAFNQNKNHSTALREMVGTADYLLSIQPLHDIPEKYKTVAAALANGDEILRRINEVYAESPEHYLRRCRDDINRRLLQMEYAKEKNAAV